MRALTAFDVLDIGERGMGQSPLERSLTLLAAASEAESWKDLAALPIGQRDARLVALREQTFGGRIDGFDRCPACAEPLELNLLTQDLLKDTAGEAMASGGRLEIDGLVAVYRVPTSFDLQAVAGAAGTEAVGRELLERCAHVERAGVPIPPDELHSTVQAAILEGMAAADPLAEILLDLTCPACGEQWQALFDPGAFLWAELLAHARRLLSDVPTVGGKPTSWR